MADDILQIFRAEALETIDRFFEALSRVGDPDPAIRREQVSEIMRLLHNLKGAGRAAGQPVIEDLAHALEDRFAPYRDGESVLDEGEQSFLARAVVALGRAAEGELDVPSVRVACEALGVTIDTSDAQAAGPDSARPGPTPASEANGSGGSRNRAEGETVRVSVERLDSLMAQVGDLLLMQSRLELRGQEIEALSESLQGLRRQLPAERRAPVNQVVRRAELLSANERQDRLRFDHLTDRLSQAMKRLRMIPLADLATSWRRIVREAAQDMGRQVELELSVGEIELDRRVLERLRAPFMHLLRNAVGHGIEAPETRQKAGKAPAGTIRVHAAMAGTKVSLVVGDDGQGFDAEAIGAKALSLGLVDEARLASMDDREKTALVLRSGLSTRDGADRVAGRGVGLDIVAEEVESLGGTVALGRSSLGGAKIALTVPTTLVSTRGLLVKSADTVYAFPIEHVERTARAQRDDLVQVDGGVAATLEDGTPIRLEWLSALMGRGTRTPDTHLVFLVVSSGGRRKGLVIDHIVGEAEFVTRPLPWNIQRLPGVHGTVVLGNGTLAVVVDVPELFSTRVEGAAHVLGAREVRRIPRLLVADDSLTSRTLHRNVLAAAGYDVQLTVDGEAAWEALEAGDFDLLVSDVQMPRLDGIGLCRRVRANQETRSLPVVLVTSLSRPEEIAEGEAAGADVYLVKGEFDSQKLLDAVSRLV